MNKPISLTISLLLFLSCNKKTAEHIVTKQIGIYHQVCDLGEEPGTISEIFKVLTEDNKPVFTSISKKEFEDYFRDKLNHISVSDHTEINIQSIVRKNHTVCVNSIIASENIDVAKFSDLIEFLNKQLSVRSGTFYKRGFIHAYITSKVQLTNGKLSAIIHEG